MRFADMVVVLHPTIWSRSLIDEATLSPWPVRLPQVGHVPALPDEGVDFLSPAALVLAKRHTRDRHVGAARDAPARTPGVAHEANTRET